MNIAIIGARRAKNGIGEYIARYFHLNGASVTCVLGTSQESSSDAAENLKRYGIKAKPYSDLNIMMDKEELDAVAIASPGNTHYAYLKECIGRGLSIFCEKPFLEPGRDHFMEDVASLLSLASSGGNPLAMNSQWPFCLPFYEELCGRTDPGDVRSFSIRLSPMCAGIDMIPDSVPHGLSILHAALGEGRIKDLAMTEGDQGMDIQFIYETGHGACAAYISLVREMTQPRTFSFGFNGRIAQRIINPETYAIHLDFEGKRVRIQDPLDLSVRDFMHACAAGTEPMIGRDHIASTSQLLKQIYSAYDHRQERITWKS